MEGMPKFWCCDENLAMELKGLEFKVCKVQGVGGRHLEVEVDCDVSGVRRRVESGWGGTRRMLERKGFEAYLMLDGPGLRRFIGKSGRGIRGFRRLTGKRVFIVPIVWRENLMFDVFVSSASLQQCTPQSTHESPNASAMKTHCEKD